MLAEQAKPLVRILGADVRVDDLRARDIHEDDKLVEGEQRARELAGLDRIERRRRVAATGLPYTAARLAEGASYSTVRKELLLLRRILTDCARRHELTLPVADLLPARYRPDRTAFQQERTGSHTPRFRQPPVPSPLLARTR
jgi:hypothetical protein